MLRITIHVRLYTLVIFTFTNKYSVSVSISSVLGSLIKKKNSSVLGSLGYISSNLDVGSMLNSMLSPKTVVFFFFESLEIHD